MGRHSIIIPNWIPTRLNEVRGRHWRAEHRAKQQTAELIRVYALDGQVPGAEGKRRVSLNVTLGPKRNQPDKDAYDKIMLDALKLAGMLIDDSARGLEGKMEVSFSRGPKSHTEIVLEDV